MKKIIFAILSLCLSVAAQAAPHETVCGGPALEAAEALLRINNKNIQTVSQDGKSMKLVRYSHDSYPFERWDVALNIKEKGKSALYRSTVVRVSSSIEFGKDGSAICTVNHITMPFAD